MFNRILCGVDETPEAIEAVRQARRLGQPDSELVLVGVLDVAAAVHAGWAATPVLAWGDWLGPTALVVALALVASARRVPGSTG